ncbi:PAS domain-containing protein [Jatrophihabitans sp. YIM 134969]
MRDVYLHDRGIADTAHRHRVRVLDVSRALHSAYRRVAALVLEPEVDGPPAAVPWRPATAVRSLAKLPTATWRWNTADERMVWSDGMYEMYGYPIGAVPATIGLHQAHKHADDRAAVERLVMIGATQSGAVVFPQRILRTDGSVCRVVMRVTGQRGPGEVLTGHVVVDTTVG